ncbi:MAG: hypothetical protein ACUVQG_00790 [Thermogutta sp.]
MAAENIPFDSNEQNSQAEIPLIRGFIVFLESGMCQIPNVLRRFDTSRCRILSIHATPQCGAATLKLVASHPEEGRLILERGGLPIADYHLIGVFLPDGVQPLLRVYLPLVQANVGVAVTHMIPLRARNKAAILLEVDSIPRAAEILLAHGFQLIDDDVLAKESGE